MKRSLFAVCATPAASLALAVSAQAACVPQSQSFSDSPVDGDLAPEIVSMSVGVDAGCNLTVSYTLANRSAGLLSSDFLSWFIDTDNDRGTGNSSGYAGAEIALGLLPNSANPGVSFWDGARFSGTELLPPAPPFTATVPLSRLGVGENATIALAGGSSWTSTATGNVYNDFAPEVLAPFFTFSVSPASAPAPTPSPSPPPAPASIPGPIQTIEKVPAPAGSGGGAQRECVVPNVTGLKLGQARKRLRSAGCKVGAVKRVKSDSLAGKVVRTTPGQGRTLASGASVDVLVGKRSAKGRAATASDERAEAVNHLNRAVASR